jgi:uridylate kinase
MHCIDAGTHGTVLRVEEVSHTEGIKVVNGEHIGRDATRFDAAQWSRLIGEDEARGDSEKYGQREVQCHFSNVFVMTGSGGGTKSVVTTVQDVQYPDSPSRYMYIFLDLRAETSQGAL